MAKIFGSVQAEVVIDIQSGDIVWAKIGDGHPSLRRAAKDAICQAKFYPTFITSPLIKVSGTIIYKFGKK